VAVHIEGGVGNGPRGSRPGQADFPRPAGDSADTFAECYSANFAKLASQLYLYTGEFALAQDLVQEAFCRAYARWDKLSAYDDPVAWLRRVAFNLANSRWQRARVAMRHHRQQRPTYVEGPGPDRVATVTALARLPEAHRRVLVLHYLADLSVAEIATQERVAIGTVKSWLHRGRASLAGLLGDHEGNNV
jgi:RNA polymerase sigma-70 factor (ECF subfamily)